MTLRLLRLAPSQVLVYSIVVLIGLGYAINILSTRDHLKWLVPYAFGLLIALGILAIITVPYATGSARRRADKDTNP